MHNADAQCMPEEREEVQRTEKKKKENKQTNKKNTSAISCLALKYEFYFITVNTLLITFSFITKSRIHCHSLVSTLNFICFPSRHQVQPTKLDNPR